MRLSIISFTNRGMELSLRIKNSLRTSFSQKEAIRVNKDYMVCDREASNDNIEFFIRNNKSQNGGLEDQIWNQEYDEVLLYTKHKYDMSQNDTETFPEKEYCEWLAENTLFKSIAYVQESLGEWTQKQFQQHHALIFIGACGIAVRAIAPYVQDKLKDSPVVVIDEGGSFVIPILSGHYGGANELAKKIACNIGATAVITTATDVNGLFAVDVFAKNNNLNIKNRDGIEKVSSKILAGEMVTISCVTQSEEIRLEIPNELTWKRYVPDKKVSILISPYRIDDMMADLQLCPKAFVIGIGCRRGKTFEELEAFVTKQLQNSGILWESVNAISSIDRKKDEVGIIELAKHHNLPFYTYDAEALNQMEGSFLSSSFVESQVGVDNVCERSALVCSGEGAVMKLKKTIENGMTVAIAEKRWSVRFDEA